MAYTAYAIDQQSCKDYNGLKLEEEVIKRVEQLPIVKEIDGTFVCDYEKGTSGETLAVISVYLNIHKSEGKLGLPFLSGFVVKRVMVDTVSQLKVEHRFLFYKPELVQTVARVSEVRNEYELVLNHLVASFNTSIKSLVHYLKIGENLKDSLI